MQTEEYSTSSSSSSEEEYVSTWEPPTPEERAEMEESGYQYFLRQHGKLLGHRDFNCMDLMLRACPVDYLQKKFKEGDNEVITDLIAFWQVEHVVFERYLFEEMNRTRHKQEVANIAFVREKAQDHILKLQRAKQSLTMLPGGSPVMIKNAGQVNVNSGAQQINNNDGTEEDE